MKIDYIEAHNFRSYGHFKFVLDNKGLILIKGQNGNIDERRSNGSGKSSFIYALLYALYGETPDGAKGDEIIKNDVGKDCFARVSFSHFNHHYLVTRYRKNNEYKNKVIVERDSKDITLSTNKETDKEIVDILGFGFDTMLNSMIFSPEKLNTFVSATDKKRKAMLEELTNTNIYKQAQALVKIDRDTDNESLSKGFEKQKQLVTLIESQKALQSQYEQNKANHDQQVKNIKQQIQHYQVQLAQQDIAKQKTDYQNNQAKLERLKQQLAQLAPISQAVTNQSANLEVQLNQKQYEQTNLKQQIADLMGKAKELVNSKDAVCSWCGSDLDKEHKQLELSNIKQKATELGKQYLSYNQPIQQLKAKVDVAKAKEAEQQKALAQQQTKYQAVNHNYQDLLVTNNQLKNDIQAYDTLNLRLREAKDQLENLAQQSIEAPKLTLDKLSLELNDLNSKVKKLQAKQDDYKKLIQIYSDKGVKAQALSAVIPFLNQQLANILKVLTNDTMSASLSSHTKTKSGKVNNQLDLLINSAVSGSNYQDLSSGEKRRIGIALNIAFMQYLKSQIGGLNLAVFDEVFDNLDSEGIDQVIAVLNKLKSDIPNIIIISHNNDLNFNDQIDSKILIKKIDNTSKMVNN